jgi:mannose-6-phosphate isomerase-like protein (cupin superfamily)
MADYAVKSIDEMEAAFLGGMKRARAELGVESFGMQVIDLPPNFDQYPEHDHSESGQEEVYVVLRGGGEIAIGGEQVPLEVDRILRVGPGEKRKVVSGPEGIRLLALGGTPGQAYEAPEVTQLGAPDPMATS